MPPAVQYRPISFPLTAPPLQHSPFLSPLTSSRDPGVLARIPAPLLLLRLLLLLLAPALREHHARMHSVDTSLRAALALTHDENRLNRCTRPACIQPFIFHDAHAGCLCHKVIAAVRLQFPNCKTNDHCIRMFHIHVSSSQNCSCCVPPRAGRACVRARATHRYHARDAPAPRFRPREYGTTS